MVKGIMLIKGPSTSHNSLKITIRKNVFNIDLHHDLVKVQVEEGLDAKRNGHIAFRGWYFKLMGG